MNKIERIKNLLDCTDKMAKTIFQALTASPYHGLNTAQYILTELNLDLPTLGTLLTITTDFGLHLPSDERRLAAFKGWRISKGWEIEEKFIYHSIVTLENGNPSEIHINAKSEMEAAKQLPCFTTDDLYYSDR